MTVFKIKNLTTSKQPLHTVNGVRNLGPRRTREFDLSGPGEKLARSSEVVQIIEDTKTKAKKAESEASDVHGEGGSAAKGGSEEGSGGASGAV